MNVSKGPDEADGWFYAAGRSGAEGILRDVWTALDENAYNMEKSYVDLGRLEGQRYRVTVTVKAMQ